MSQSIPSLPILDGLRVASPCSASWDDMIGDARQRSCASCRKTVYNLAELTTAEALALVTAEGERPCVRFYRRRDGTVMTADCPVGAGVTLRRRVRRLAAAGVALLAATAGGAMIVRPAPEAEDLTPNFPSIPTPTATPSVETEVTVDFAGSRTPPAPVSVKIRLGDCVAGCVDDALVAVGLRSRRIMMGESIVSGLPPVAPPNQPKP